MVQFAGMPRNRVPPKPFGTQRARPYTIAKLLRMSLSYPDRFWARHVRIRRTAWMMDKKGRKTLRAETTTDAPNTPPKRGHFCSYRPVDPNYEGLLSDCPAVIVACSCQRWCFQWEYAAWYRGVSELNYCNGQFPDVTNPQLRIGLCVAKGELVNTQRGFVPIEKVVVGDKVWSHKGWYKVSAAALTGKNKKVVNITTKQGRSLKLTKDHIIPVFDSEQGIIDIKVASLNINKHKLLISAKPSQSPAKTININPKNNTVNRDRDFKTQYKKGSIKLDATLAELMGYMIAEGSISKQNLPSFAGQNEYLLADFKNKWEKIFGKNTVYKRQDGLSLGSAASTILKDLGFISGSYNKLVPEWVMQGDEQIIIAFLRGLYAGDGNFRENFSTYASVSYRLARNVQLLLTSLNIITSLNCYMTGVRKSHTWVVRTTSVIETSKLFDLLKPIRGYSAKKAKSNIFVSNTEYLTKGYRNVISAVIDKHLPISKDISIITLIEATKKFDTGTLDTLAAKLSKNKKLIKKRLQKSGKPHNAATIADIHKIIRPRLIKKIIQQIKLPVQGLYKQSRYKLLEPLQKLKKILPKAYDELQYLVDENVHFESIASINSAGKSEVYDLTVEGSEYFSVNGIIVHNCKHLIVLGTYILQKRI